MKTIIVLILSFTLMACQEVVKQEDIATNTYHPYDDVTVTLTLKRVTYDRTNNPYTTVFMNYAIDRSSDLPLYFSVGSTKFSVNSQEDKGAFSSYPNTTVKQHWIPINSSHADFRIYAVFDSTFDKNDINQFQVLSYGLTRGKAGDEENYK